MKKTKSPATPAPSRQTLWENLEGCDCPPKGTRGMGRNHRCSKTAVRCNGRLAVIKKNFDKYGYTFGPPR